MGLPIIDDGLNKAPMIPVVKNSNEGGAAAEEDEGAGAGGVLSTGATSHVEGAIVNTPLSSLTTVGASVARRTFRKGEASVVFQMQHGANAESGCGE